MQVNFFNFKSISMATAKATATNLKTVSFKGFLTDLSGKEMKEHKKNEVLSTMLAGLPKGNAVKLYGWAMDIYRTGSVTVDKADMILLKELIENCETFTVLTKAQLLECFE